MSVKNSQGKEWKPNHRQKVGSPKCLSGEEHTLLEESKIIKTGTRQITREQIRIADNFVRGQELSEKTSAKISKTQNALQQSSHILS